MKDLKTCENCNYWLRVSEAHGTCQRHAPTPVVARPGEEIYEYDERGEPIYIAIWPQTNELDWCKEHSEEKKL